MSFKLYTDVVLTRNIPEDNLKIGDIGTVIECHEVEELETGYTVEFFNLTGHTIALITVPKSWLRLPTDMDILTVRSKGIETFA